MVIAELVLKCGYTEVGSDLHTVDVSQTRHHTCSNRLHACSVLTSKRLVVMLIKPADMEVNELIGYKVEVRDWSKIESFETVSTMKYMSRNDIPKAMGCFREHCHDERYQDAPKKMYVDYFVFRLKAQ